LIFRKVNKKINKNTYVNKYMP